MSWQCGRTLFVIAVFPFAGLAIGCGDDTTPELSSDASVPNEASLDNVDATSAVDSGGADAQEAIGDATPGDASAATDGSTRTDASTPRDGGSDAAKSSTCVRASDCADGMLCMTGCIPVSGGGGCTPTSACIVNTCDAGVTSVCSTCISSLFCNGYSGCAGEPDAGTVTCLTGG